MPPPLDGMVISRLSPRPLDGFGSATYTLDPSDTTPLAAPPVRSALHDTLAVELLVSICVQLEPPVHTHQLDSVLLPDEVRRTPPSASTAYSVLVLSIDMAVMAGRRTAEPVPILPAPT